MPNSLNISLISYLSGKNDLRKFSMKDQLHPDQYKSREKVTIMSRSIIIDFVQYEIFIYIYP